MNLFLDKITKYILDKNNKISASRLLWYFRKNPIDREELFGLTLGCIGEENFMERIFWLQNKLTDYIKCANPKCNANLVGITYWSVSKENIGWNKDNHRLTCSNTCKHELHRFRKNEVHEKRVTTFISKYGIDNSAHLSTNSYKTNNPMKNPKTVEKMKNTCLEKYGVDNASKVGTIMEKIINHGHRAKDYIFPSGKVVRIRGYEWRALDELLKIYDESELEVSAKKIPKIKYYWTDGTEHYYFPDIYIEKDNLLIEVKSTYFMKKDYDKNIQKKVATEQAGYDFRFMIYDE